MHGFCHTVMHQMQNQTQRENSLRAAFHCFMRKYMKRQASLRQFFGVETQQKKKTEEAPQGEGKYLQIEKITVLRVMENLEIDGSLEFHFPGPGKSWKLVRVKESLHCTKWIGKLLNLGKLKFPLSGTPTKSNHLKLLPQHGASRNWLR